MSVATFIALANLPFAEVYIAVELQSRDPETEAIREYRITNAPRLFTLPTDDPPNEQFLSVLMKGWRTERSLTVLPNGRIAKTFTGPSSFNRGALIIDASPTGNPFASSATDTTLPSPFADWLDVDWSGQPITIKVGARVKADGTAYAFADFVDFATGLVQSVNPGPDGTLEIVIAGTKKLCTEPVVIEQYRGFGGAAQVPTTRFLSTPSDALWSVDTVVLEWIGVMSTAGAVNFIAHGTGDYGIALSGGNTLGIMHSGGTKVFGTFPMTVGEPLSVAITYTPLEGSTSVVLYAGKSSLEMSAVMSLTVPALAPATSFMEICRVFGGGVFECWDARVWSTRTASEIIAGIDAPVADPASQSSLLGYWKFEQGEGDVAFGAKGPDMTYSSTGLIWVSTLEGDDPQNRSGSLQGKSKPDGYGALFNVPVTNVDSQRHLGQWSRIASTDLRRLKVDGAPMVPDETVTSVGVGDISFDDTDDAFVLSVPSGLTGRRFVPGQADPSIRGQSIVVINAPGYNATYRLAVGVEGALADELRIKVVDEFGDPLSPAPASAALPAGTEIRTLAAERQYTFNLATSTVDTPQEIAGVLTADAVLRLVETAKVSEVVTDILAPSVVESVLTFDPIVSTFFFTGTEIKICEAIDELMRSCLGWWIEKRGGGFKIGNYTLPTETPVAALLGSRAAEVGATVDLPPVLGSIERLVRRKTVVPSWRTSAGHARTWHVHPEGSTKSSVARATRDTLESQYRITPRPFPETKDRWPTSDPLPLLKTLLVDPSEVETFLDLSADLFTEQRGWYDADVSGLGLLAVELADVVLLQHPEPTLGVETATPARIVSMVEDTSSDLVQVGLYL